MKIHAAKPPPTYTALRQRAYPATGAQLDMLWHAMAAGDTPKSEPWFSTIAAIKAQYPKPLPPPEDEA